MMSTRLWSRRKREQDVNVIAGAADGQEVELAIARYSAHVGPQRLRVGEMSCARPLVANTQ